MPTSKLIKFTIILFYTKCATMFAYPIENIVVPDHYFNHSSGNDRISSRGSGSYMDWLPVAFCDSGMPLLKSRFCNGKKECQDGSDETVERCRNKSCGDDMFRCNYGACISKMSICDGVFECADGSDEVYEFCRQSSCILPYPTNDTVYFVPGCEECLSGSIMKGGTVLRHQCLNNKFSRAVLPDIICRNGIWIPSLPSCKSGIVENGSTITVTTIDSTLTNTSTSTTKVTPVENKSKKASNQLTKAVTKGTTNSIVTNISTSQVTPVENKSTKASIEPTKAVTEETPMEST